MVPVFSVTCLATPVRVYQVKFPMYSAACLCCTSLEGEHTVYKYKDEDDAQFESMSIRFDPRDYYVFSVHEDCPGLDHIGIVHFLSGLFTKADIPILYVNTYASNLIFIAEEHKGAAVAWMQQAGILMDNFKN